MSFGFSTGDLIGLGTLAWNIYMKCKQSSDDFKRLSQEVASLYAVLKEAEEYIQETKGLNPAHGVKLSGLVKGVRDALEELQRMLDSYESLGTQAQRTWDRLKWNMEDLADVRSRIISNTTLLTAFNASLAMSSTARIEKKLEKFIAEVRAGLREGSVVTTPAAVETLEHEDVWLQLRRELEDVGISASVIEEHHLYIAQWFKTAIENGILEEVQIREPESSFSQDSGYGESMGVTTASLGNSMALADQEFENELRDHPSRAGCSPDDGDGITIQPVQTRKASAVSRVLFKLLKKDTAIIEAASDGDTKKVASLISSGANVNAKDRWGWSALSMCGYGGHIEIARLLLDHGAEIDNVDVDGDTPESLATNRKHAQFVILLDEVRAARDLRDREAYAEQTRPDGHS